MPHAWNVTDPAARSREADATQARRSPVAFLGLTALLAVPFWALGALVETPEGAPVRLPTSALQVVCPFAAAAVLVFREDGTRGLRTLVARTLHRGRTPSWRAYAVAVGVMPAVYASGYLLMRARGVPLAPPDVAVTSVAVLTAVFLLSAALEEAGWTAYALEPLRDRAGALGAALILGFAWAAFHLIPDLQGGRDVTWIAPHRASSIALRVLIVWVFAATGRGGLAAVLLHAVDNLSWSLYPDDGATYDPAYTAPFTIAAAAVAGASLSRGGGSGRVVGGPLRDRFMAEPGPRLTSPATLSRPAELADRLEVYRQEE